MSWVKLDDRYFDNPKIAALSDAAQLADLKAMTYCARELTDGFLPSRKAREFATPKVIKELVPGRWEMVEGGFMVHDYLKYNPTRADVLKGKDELRQARSKAGSKGAASRWQTVWQNDGPVAPIPEGDFKTNPLPIPKPHTPPPEPVPVPSRGVVVGFEQCFARLLSPMELEQVKALEEEHPPERIEFALREAAALNKRSVRYIQRTCERIANDGNTGGAGSGESTKAAHPNGVAGAAAGLDRRSAAIARLGRGG